MQRIITGKQQNQFTSCDETMKRALNMQTIGTIGTKENQQLSHEGFSLKHTSVWIRINCTGQIVEIPNFLCFHCI